MTGEIAKSDFRTWTTNHGGVWLHFNNMLSGTLLSDQLQPRHGVAFATLRNDADSKETRDIPVITSSSYAYNLGRVTFVASRAGAAVEEKYSPYEIRFDRPQRWVGIHRYWRGPTLTRFHGPRGDILYEGKGEGFHAWFAETNETNTWISRIEVTGEPREGRLQVGHSDDLIFGTPPIPRRLEYLSIRSISPALDDPGAAARVEVDYTFRSGTGTNDWFLTTNALPAGTQERSLIRTNVGIFLDPK